MSLRFYRLRSAVAARSCTLHINDMSEHRVTLKWERGGAEFSYQKYPRDHTWIFRRRPYDDGDGRSGLSR